MQHIQWQYSTLNLGCPRGLKCAGARVAPSRLFLPGLRVLSTNGFLSELPASRLRMLDSPCQQAPIAGWQQEKDLPEIPKLRKVWSSSPFCQVDWRLTWRTRWHGGHLKSDHTCSYYHTTQFEIAFPSKGAKGGCCFPVLLLYFSRILFRDLSGSALQASGAAERSGDEAAEPAGGRERGSDKGREQKRHPT